MERIVIVNYGMGNLRSVQKALERCGVAAVISDQPEDVANADRLILPGVGAFRDAMDRLRSANLVEPILEHIRIGKPFLGICLGLQLLFTKSYEDGEHQGLNVLGGDVVRFEVPEGLKVPHMGWNAVRPTRPDPIWNGLPDPCFMYFVHSYYVRPADGSVIAAETDYPTPFPAAVRSNNVFAVQFHPEKSQKHGLALLHNFATSS
ncbi:MAG: imidazole glycerol phosphate synthase subunit HisH [Gemmatales bacterium]|nr:imidazole glycerol phosphate synthase subunit HisH [Gemmatales bacterium]MDW8387422.1 imidazole glycerol phosphate synthase subunit HisH [Gemmatales bacterium]